MTNCQTCGGDGWYLDHSDACYSRNNCIGTQCPVQRQCECQQASTTPQDGGRSDQTSKEE